MRSKVDLDLSRSTYTSFDAPWRDKHDGIKIVALPFKIKDFIVQKPFWKILEFWTLVTSILTWAKKWPKWFRNDFSRAFERRFPFVLRCAGAEIDGGEGVQTPPIRWWKIQRPIRARVNIYTFTFYICCINIYKFTFHHRIITWTFRGLEWTPLDLEWALPNLEWALPELEWALLNLEWDHLEHNE